MLFDRRIGFVLLACVLGATSGCQRASPSVASAGPPVAAAAKPPASPDDIVRTRAPSGEIAFLNGDRDFKTGADADAANVPANAEAQAARAAAWKKIVLGIGAIKDWVGYTKSIDGTGRIEIVLSDGLVVFAWIPKQSRLFGVVESLSESNQPVVISGRISPSFLGAAAVSDDAKYPTCFENRFGPSGCEIELTSIAPLH